LRRIFAAGRSSLLAAATQGLGLLQLLLLVNGTPSSESDAYFYLITWAQLPTQIILSGFVYPTWLSSVSGVRRKLMIAIAAAPILAVAGVAAAGFIFSNLSRPHDQFVVQLALFAFLGILLSAGWTFALRLSVEGDTSWASAVTLCSNVLSCGALLALLDAPQADRLSAMLIAQIVGMVATISFILYRDRGLLTRVFAEPQTSRPAQTRVDWYLAQSIIGYGSLLVLQTTSVALAPAALSVLGLIGRFVSGLNMVVTNAVIPRLVHSGTTSDRPALTLVKWTALSMLGTGLLLGLFGAWTGTQLAVQAAVVCAWFACAITNSTFKRLAVRSIEPRAAAIVSILNLATATVVGVLFGTGLLSLEILILAYVAMDLLPAIALGFLLRRWILAIAIAVPSTVVVLFASVALQIS